MFRTRLISGIVLVAAALATIIAGGPVLVFTLLAVSLIGLFEFYRVMKIEEGSIGLLTLTGYLGTIAYYVLIWLAGQGFALAALLITLILCMCFYVFSWPVYNSTKVAACIFGMVYVSIMLSHIYLTRVLPDGQFTVWLIFICSWGCDTFAYCTGMLFGKHKMSPKLSPKKSVEGAVGGVAGAVLLGALYALIVGRFMAHGSAPIWEYALISGVGALISMVGDLAASAIKRDHNIKDYGKLIPGHGGILDRFDSVIFTAPVIWLLTKVLL